ncbi:MAG TPA: hypothetical protein VF146_00645, partial [Bryobacteraceae bacterium]
MAAGEDQAKPIVGNVIAVVVWDFRAFDQRTQAGNLLPVPRQAPDPVDRLVPRRLDDPGPWKIGNSRRAPLAYLCRKSFLRSFFGDLEI